MAWHEARPVAKCEVLWDGCVDPEVRAATPGCPEINGLEVVESLRSQGIGTALIAHAEQLVAERGLRMIGLGVFDGNPRAAALYGRLGYRPRLRYLDRYSYTDDSGVDHLVEDPCVYLTKEIA